MSKILCYEINEVPWRVIDFYLAQRPDSTLKSLLDVSNQFTTHTPDVGELQPWSTWPTLHRGVSNQVHEINFLNQDLSAAEKWPPIWKLLTDAGISVGIFGSLQSYPPIQAESVKFHIPDTFAAGSETLPRKYEPFQAFNLKQTGKNSAVASTVSTSDATQAIGLLRSGIRPATLGKVAAQLVHERRNRLHKSRRALLQPELAFDVFRKCLKEEQPQFVTFFSNHVAGIMHRYWKYSFPEDFNYTLKDEGPDQFHAQSIMVAMDILDKQLKELMALCDQYDYQLMLCSSMGQEAIDRGDYIPEPRMKDFDAFKASLNLDFDFGMNLAMQPDVAFEFKTDANLQSFMGLVANFVDTDGKTILYNRFDPVGKTLNMMLRRSAALAKNHTVLLNGQEAKAEDFGLEIIERDIGTAYHQPEGIWIWQQEKAPERQQREVVDSRQVLPSLLEYFDVPRRDYMQPPITAS